MNSARIVVVGGGHAAAQLCSALVEGDAAQQLLLVAEEGIAPYQRPPLSKSFLKSAQEAVQLHRDVGWFEQHGVELLLGRKAVAIDRGRRELELDDGQRVAYEQLVLATGARARVFAPFDRPLENVHSLRGAVDASRLRTSLLTDARGSLSVLGGGFIGLEVAATARALGWHVQVFEAASRLLSRSVSPTMARHVLEQHLAQGTEVMLESPADGFEVEGRRLQALRMRGRRVDVDQLLLGVGSVASIELAQRAGLKVDQGIVVDASQRSSDASILAIGDCASFPMGDRYVRLESVQNANAQARVAAAVLMGQVARYRPLPWFWSDQGGMRLQMAGLWREGLTAHERRGATPHSFSLFHYEGERLRCVESVNAPSDHLAARKWLEQEVSPDPGRVRDPSVALKTLL